MSVFVTGSPPAPQLVDGAVARPALTSTVRPSLVLREQQARALLEAARLNTASFSTSRAGVRLWKDGVLVGGVDWTYDTPSRDWVMIHRSMVTAEGLVLGESTTSVLARVLGLVNITVDGEQLSLPSPPPRDPFFTPSA